MPFQLFAQPFGGEWKRTQWHRPVSEPAKDGQADWQISGSPRTPGDHIRRPVVLLQPGDDCLAYLSGDETTEPQRKAIKSAAYFKIAITVNKTSHGAGWHGTIETPPAPANFPPDWNESLSGSVPCPKLIPEFSKDRANLGANAYIGPPQFDQVRTTNEPLVNLLRVYEADGVRKEFERRMNTERDKALKLLYSAIASSAGSEAAALFLLESLKPEDEYDLRSALNFVLEQTSPGPPDWIVELVEAVIRHDLAVDPTRPHSVDHETALLIAELGRAKCARAVPFLTELVAKTKDSPYVVASLASTGDPRVAPVLIELLKRKRQLAEYTTGFQLPEGYTSATDGLVKQKAGSAVPVLLENVSVPEVIEALGKIGDKRALPRLREIVAANGKLVKNSTAPQSELDQLRWYAARIAVAELEGDAVPVLCEIVDNKSIDQFQRRAAVWRLADRPDPRAVPVLIRAIKNDPSGPVVNQSIEVVSLFKFKAAVEGLIECMDAKFEGKADWKRATDPESFRENIATSLRTITGAPIGADKRQWQLWWQEHKTTAKLD